MDIPVISEKTSKTFKKAPEMKNIRKDGSFNVEEIIAKQNNTLNLDAHAISRQRRASFGNCLQVNLPITTKKSKSSENLKAPKLKKKSSFWQCNIKSHILKHQKWKWKNLGNIKCHVPKCIKNEKTK